MFANTSKLKFKTKENKTLAIVNVQVPNEALNLRTFEYVSKNEFKFLLSPKRISKRTVRFSCLKAKNLQAYLQATITRFDFFCILLQVALMFKMVLKKQELSTKDLVLDARYTFIVPATKDVYFLYLPVQSNMPPSLSYFMENIVYHMRVADTEGFVPTFIHLIKSKEIEREHELNYIIDYIVKQEPRLSYMLNDKQLVGSGFLTADKAEQQRHEANKAIKVNPHLVGEIHTTLFEEPAQAPAALPHYMEETGLMPSLPAAESDATTLLNVQAACHGKLLRKATGEVFSLNKHEILLGKDAKKVDYALQGNLAISRTHAKFSVKNGRVFIQDLNSKNHTFVNSVPLTAFQEVELFNQSVFWIADEEFMLQL